METGRAPAALDPRAAPVDEPDRRPTVLVFAVEPERRETLSTVIESAGWIAMIAETAADAVRAVETAPPELLLLGIGGDHADELAVLDEVRASIDGDRVPVVCVVDHPHRALTVDAFGRRADDVVGTRVDPTELIARLRVRMERRPVPTSDLVEDPVTGALTPRATAGQLTKEHERVARGGDPGILAFLSIEELPAITARGGARARDEVLAQVVRLVKRDGRRLDFIGTRRGVLALLLPSTPRKGAEARLERLVRIMYGREFTVLGRSVRLTPIIGYTETTGEVTPEEIEERAWDAMLHQGTQLDMYPTRWVAALSPSTPRPRSRVRRTLERFRTPLQVVAQQLAALLLPVAIYGSLDQMGIDITGGLYLLIVAALALTAANIWAESRAALAPTVLPEPREGPLPPASAVIAAYLPNEADTILETVEAFLALDYPDLEILLAYNTPRSLPVEDELRAIAARDPRFRPLRVEGSVSKAQNVNAALAHVRGHFLGLFDADHHPAPGSFQRAWRWLDAGAGVVQGHCVIRNGATNFVTRLVAVEFESIYAVAHPGRARVHGFGIFGGSNGYWRTSLLQRTRMRGSMLTEDIDSSMRVVQQGETIVSDPDLVSTELAPETFGALWNQRLRWAQGWSQVSLRHLAKMMRAAPTLRQRLGVFYLLGWREIYPWISLQMFPLLAYWWWRGEGRTDWFVPIFVATSVFTLSVGPAQAWFAYRLARPELRRYRSWFVWFFLASLGFFTEWKNVIGRTAQLKEAMRERKWKVTPRSGSVAADAHADAAPVDGGIAEVSEVDTRAGDGAAGAGDHVTDAAGNHIVDEAIDDTGDAAPPAAAADEAADDAVEAGAHDALATADPGPRRDRPPIASARRHAARPRRHRTRSPLRPRPAGSRPHDGVAVAPTLYDLDREPPPPPAIYDVERETSPVDPVEPVRSAVYDVEREPGPPTPLAIYDADGETSDADLPVTTGLVPRARDQRTVGADVRERPELRSITPIDPTTGTSHRPMILGVEGMIVPPRPPRASAGVAELEEAEELLVGDALELEPLGAGGRAADELDLASP